MYFLGYSDLQGWGLYEVANFNLRKVSPPGLDAVLNNIDDFTGQSSPEVLINIVDVFGHAVLLFRFSSTTDTNPVQYVFEIPKDLMELWHQRMGCGGNGQLYHQSHKDQYIGLVGVPKASMIIH